MAKDEAFGQLDGISDPLREVHVADHASLFGILVSDQLLEIVEAEVLFLPKVPQDVFDGNVTVVVRVEVKEGFAHRSPVGLELDFQPVFESFESLNDDL